MDVLTQNSLLKIIFAEIAVYPIGCKRKKAVQAEAEQMADASGGADTRPRGCLVMRLAGVDTPLPPVRMRRLRGKDMRLPSVTEWVADIYALAPVEAEAAGSNVRARRPFYQVLHRLVGGLAEVGSPEDDSRPGDAELRQLLTCIQTDKEFPRRCKGEKMIRVHLAQNDLYSQVRRHFEEAWSVYLQTEQQRLAPSLVDPPLAPPLK